jgi:benzoate-CoA ligase family protein
VPIPERINMARYFLDARVEEGLGEKTAVLTRERDYTYRRVQELAGRFGNRLRAAGVRPEERVLLALPDGIEMVAALFGALKLGAVVVMVNPELKADAFEYFLDYTRSRVAVTASGSLAELGPPAAASPHLLATLVVDDPGFAAELEAAEAALDTFPSHRDDPAIWLFSGGTTGRPKAVVQTHRSFVNTTETYARTVLGYTAGDVTLSVPKLYFGYALGSNLLFPFAAGATAALFPERCTPEAVLEAAERFRPTVLINVPTMIGKLLAEPDAGADRLASLRLSTSAGEALPEELYHRWRERFGCEILDGLGTAEMWHVFLSNHPGEVRPGSLGRPVEGFEVEVRDDDGRDLGPGEVGWLWVRGGSLALGYWQRADRTAQAFRGEWYVSGDMVRRDAEGFFYYCGRGDDMLKVSGKWLAPKELEDCLLGHPRVREVAVVGVPDDRGLAKPWAFVVADGGAAGLEDELKQLACEPLEPYKAPRTVVVMDDLPRTHLGKVDRGALRRLHAGG